MTLYNPCAIRWQDNVFLGETCHAVLLSALPPLTGRRPRQRRPLARASDRRLESRTRAARYGTRHGLRGGPFALPAGQDESELSPAVCGGDGRLVAARRL